MRAPTNERNVTRLRLEFGTVSTGARDPFPILVEFLYQWVGALQLHSKSEAAERRLTGSTTAAVADSQYSLISEARP